MRNLFLPALFAVAVSVAPSALAADSGEKPVSPPPDTDKIVVSATRTPRPSAEIGSAVTIIDAAVIEARQYSFVADALRDAPGVAIARNGSFGGVASVRMRGAASGQTLVVIDGVVVNDPAAPQGGFNFANLDIVDIDRIEVLRGPQSILYGADAIGGVILITTKADSDHTVAAFVEGGSRATARGGATLSGAAGPASARLTVSGIRTGGVSRAANGDEDDGFRSVAASLRSGVALNRNWRAELIARYGDAHADIDGFPPPLFSLADTNEAEDTEDYAVAARVLHRSSDFNGALTLSYNAINRVNSDADIETFSAEGDRISADYLADMKVSENYSLIGGAEVERTSVVVSGVDESATAGAAFAMIEAKPIAGATISAGVRRDEFSNFDGATTARIAAAWEVSDTTILRASWGQGFRAPTLFELNFSQFGVVPNPDLRPERASGFDGGLEHAFGADKSVRVRATLFHQRTKNQIDFDFAGFGYFNIDRTRARGAEFEAEMRAAHWLTASMAYTFTDAIDANTRLRQLRIPKHSGSLIVTATPTPVLTLSASAHFNGAEPDTPAPNDSYVRLDLRAAYAVSDQLEIFGRVENATDANYQDVSGYGEPGASIFGGVRLRL